MEQKEVITSSNIHNYFDLRSVGPRQIKPGMLLSFSYRSEDRAIHDRAPLVYVMENRGDRIYGLNLHYKFALMGLLIMEKRKELEAKTGLKNKTNDPDQTGQPNQPGKSGQALHEAPMQRTNAQSGTKIIRAPGPGQPVQQPAPSRARPQTKQEPEQSQGQKQKIVTPPRPQIVRIPAQLLETYQLQIEPIEILRNYLFVRMSGLRKLIFKPK